MNIIETTFEKLPTKCLLIGFEGENLRATVRIDCASVFAEYPNATPALIVKPLFADAYPVVVDRNGTCVDWLITSEILSFNGDGEIQLIFYKDQVICKSAVSKIRVSRSLTVTGDMPDPVVQWIDRANAKLAEVDAQIVELEGMVDTATDAATRAEQSETNATAKATEAATSAATASTKAAEAQASANTATAKASEAALSATQARNSAMSAANSESGATAKAAEAAQSAQTAAQKAEQITEAAQIATGKAGEASASATAAQASATDAAASATAASASETAAKASETAASTSATQAAQSAQTANTAAQTAEQKAGEAASSASNAATSATNAATSAETASTKAGEAAQSAQAVEEAAEQLAESLEQINQNTADIAEHEQEYNALKAATLIHNTASGAIASFPDGAEMPVDEVTAQINPVQDLHGYDNPWPAGGGKNLLKTDGLSYAPPSDTEWGSTRRRTFTPNSFCVGCSANNYYMPGQLTEYSVSENRVTVTTGGVAYGVNIPIIGLTVGETYTFSATAPEGNIQIGAWQQDGTWLGVVISSGAMGTTRTFTVPENAYFIVICFLPKTSNVQAVFTNIQLEKGSTATAYAPYSNICPITGWDGVKVTRTGKNLLLMPFADYRTAPVSKNDCFFLKQGSYTFSFAETSETSWRFVLRLFDVSGNEIIDASPVGVAMPYRSSVHGYSNGVNIIYKNFSFTINNDCYVRILFWGGSTSTSSTFNGVMLELGSTATAYEPYQGETYDITFPTEAGTVYGGSLTIAGDGSGVLTVDRASATFNGSETWYWHASGVAYSAVKGGVITNATTQFNALTLCDKLKQSSWGGRGNLDKSCGMFFGASFIFIKNSESITDAATAKTWLADNPITVVYPLATPQVYNLTAAQITTLLGENNLWHDANGDISVGYKANTKLYIDGKIAELVAQIVNS